MKVLNLVSKSSIGRVASGLDYENYMTLDLKKKKRKNECSYISLTEKRMTKECYQGSSMIRSVFWGAIHWINLQSSKKRKLEEEWWRNQRKLFLCFPNSIEYLCLHCKDEFSESFTENL